MTIFIKDVLFCNNTTNILIQDNIITGIGTHLQMPVNAIIIDGANKAAFPTFANAHTHAPMSLFRSYGDDQPLQTWLEQYIWPKEKHLDEDSIYWGTRLACLEMIKSGCTAFNDMYFFLQQEDQAVLDSGIRAMLGHTLFGNADELIAHAFQPPITPSNRIKYCLAPHAIYTVSDLGLTRAANYCQQHNINFHIHMSETLKEVNDCIATHHCRPYEYINQLGILQQLGPRFVGAHSLHLSQNEINLLGQHHCNVVHNPNSNLKLGSGYLFPYPELQKAGVNITLGTDGCSSSNNLDMIEATKLMALLQKGCHNNPTLMPASDALTIASYNGFKLMGWNAGNIQEGALADLMLINLNNLAFVPNNHTTNNLVYSAHGDCVDTVICDGNIVMQNRHVADEDIIINEARRCAHKLLNQ